jgi:hypothetical protein
MYYFLARLAYGDGSTHVKIEVEEIEQKRNTTTHITALG